MSWYDLLADVTITGVEMNRSAELGKGSDATVCAGLWHGAEVAVKILHSALVDPLSTEDGRRAFIDKFVRECERLKKLRHPNIVQFLGVFRVGADQPVLVTELLASTLMQRYQTKPPLSDQQAFCLFRDGAAGLSYLHSLRIIHRDIKTRNVLVTREGRAKLADVGMSCQMSTDCLGMTAAPGTILYMAPEALLSEPSYNEQLDVFSYGVLMLAVLLRREPAKELLYMSRSKVIDDKEQVIPEVSRRCDDLRALTYAHPLYFLIVQCLQNAPEQRPTSRDILQQISTLIIDDMGHRSKPKPNFIDEDYVEPDRVTRPPVIPLPEQRISSDQETCSKPPIPPRSRRSNESFAISPVEEQEQLVADERVVRLQLAQIRRKSAEIAAEEEKLECMRLQLSRKLSSTEKRVHDEAGAAVRFCSALHLYQHSSLKKKIPNPPFSEQWSAAPKPTQSTCSRLLAVTYGDQLYVLARCEDHTSVIFCTNDLTDWWKVTTQLPLYCVTAIGCHKDHLFCLAGGPSANVNQRYLYWLNIENDMCIPVMARNGKCPHPYLCDSAASVGNSIVLFGGYNGTSTFPVVAEYSVSDVKWINGTAWLELPRPLAGAVPILLRNELHLFGGTELHDLSSGDFNASVLTMQLIDGKPSSGWQKEVIPRPPRCASGAARVHHQCVVAGGHDVAGSVYFNDCHALDFVSGKWLKLPSLTTARCSSELVLFRDSLVALGGFSRKGRGHKGDLLLHVDVEVMKIKAI